MARLNYQQVAKLVYDAGWRGKDAQTAVAIARAESSFDTMETNFAGRDHSYGLWQINMKDDLGPARRKQFGIASNEALFDPVQNARAAFAIYKAAGNRFTDWSTYNDRKYTLYLNGAVFAVKQIEQGKTGIEIPSYDPGKVPAEGSWGTESLNPLDGVKQAAEAAGKVADFVTNRENWLRAAAAVGGGILIIVAVSLVIGQLGIATALKKFIPKSAGKAVTKTVKGGA